MFGEKSATLMNMKGDAAFGVAVDYVLRREGVLSDHAKDPGGLTKYGIAKAYHPNVDIANLTVEGALAIYKEEYWTRWHCEEMPAMWAIAIFDGVVNQPPYTTSPEPVEDGVIEMMQRTMRLLPDGKVGPKTIAALWKSAQSDHALEDLADFLSRRGYRYHRKSQDVFVRGLLRRMVLTALFAANYTVDAAVD